MTKVGGNAYFIRKKEQIWLYGVNILSLIQSYIKEAEDFYKILDMDLFVYQQQEIILENINSEMYSKLYEGGLDYEEMCEIYANLLTVEMNK